MSDDLQSVGDGQAGVTGKSSAEGPKPMTDDELLTLIGEYEKNSIGSEVAAGATVGTPYYDATQEMTSAQIDRYNALNAYYARPIGNEEENRSQVVVPEFRDTVEWIMPQLMRIFSSCASPCVFEPEGPDDVQRAQTETAAVNHVFMHMNDGFNTIYDYCKDALILRNGYIRVQAVDDQEVSEETYSGLSEMGVTQLMSDKGDEDVEVVGQHEEQVDVPPPLDAPPGTPSQQQSAFSVRLRIKKDVKRIIVEAAPPEEMRIASTTRSTNLDYSPFVEHKTKKTRSDLITEGFDEDVVNGLSAVPDNFLEMDALARNELLDQMLVEDPADFATQLITVRNVTIMCDFDGDGVSERRQVLIAGNKILDNEVIEECPFSSGVPKRMSHRHTGMSLYDELIDIQVIKSELTRQVLNALRLSNNPRIGVDWKNCNLSDLMTWREGGLVRCATNPNAVLMPFQVPGNVAEQVMPMLDQLDQWRTMRTGVGAHTMGLDADALQDVTKGSQLAAMSAASLKIEMIARLLAEGLKDAYLKVHALLIRHQDVPLHFQLGEQWVETDPRQWRKRTRVSANVGLGSGNREEARANMAMLMTIQEKAGQLGLVGPKQGFNSAKQAIALLGYEHPEQYVLDPQSDEYKQLAAQRQSQPDPKVIAAKERTKQVQIQAAADKEKSQAEITAETERAQAEVAHDALQNREDRHVDMAQTDAKMFTELANILAKIVASQLKQDPSVNAGAVLREDVQSLEGR